MRVRTVVLLVSCVGSLCIGLGAWSAAVSAEGLPVSSVSAALPVAGDLVPSGAEVLLGGEGAWEAREASLSSPEAASQREQSRTEYEGIGGPEAIALAESKFGIENPGWTPPGSGEGGQITKYIGEDAAQERTAGGQHVLLASSVPLRSAVGSGQLAPVSLGLVDRGGSFVPANPLVPVSISTSASGGVTFPLGLNVAPVQAASGEASVVVGDRVVYPSTAKDTSFMVEPTPAGAEVSWELLSQSSSGENSLAFSLPEGATLQLSSKVHGGAEVVREGEALFVLPPAFAKEADGSVLPVSYTVHGDVLTTHVNLEGSVAFPVMVDPLIEGNYGMG